MRLIWAIGGWQAVKYEKARAEVVEFQKSEFLTGSGNFNGGYCRNYSHNGFTCGYVTHCNTYSTPITCGNWFECDEFGILEWDMGFLCVGFDS